MSNVDLSALRIDESSAAVPKRPLGPRLLVAGVIALTLAVAGTFLWPLLAPPRAVRTAAIHAVADQGKGGASAATATEVTTKNDGNVWQARPIRCDAIRYKRSVAILQVSCASSLVDVERLRNKAKA